MSCVKIVRLALVVLLLVLPQIGHGQSPQTRGSKAGRAQSTTQSKSRNFKDTKTQRAQTGQQSTSQQQYLLDAIQDELQTLSPTDGSARIGCLNAEFGNASKAARLASVYKEIVQEHTLLGLEEVDRQFVESLAKESGYKHVNGKVNERGQGLGLLVAPNCTIVRHEELLDTAKIAGIDQLRPDLAVVVRLPEGQEVLVVVVHKKSMQSRNSKNGAGVTKQKGLRRGELETRPIRTQQNKLLAKHLQDEGWPAAKIVIGDFNCHLEGEHPETEPLENIGLRLNPLRKQQPTHRMGGTLDGMMSCGVDVVNLQVVMGEKFWKDKKIGKSLTDHGLLTGVMKLSSVR